jgi:hypothetical protein
MQRENASAACCIFFCCAAVGGGPWGSSFSHVVCAALNFGEFGSIPVEGPNAIEPSWPGSGNFGTPFFRMHAANLAPFASFMTMLAPPPRDDEFEPLGGGEALDVVVVWLPPTSATPGDLVPPQPEATRASARTRASSEVLMPQRNRGGAVTTGEREP